MKLWNKGVKLDGQVEEYTAGEDHELDQRIAGGNLGRAIPAFSPQREEAEKGDIVIGPYRAVASHAMGRRPHDR